LKLSTSAEMTRQRFSTRQAVISWCSYVLIHGQ
jgi:hypothetical protein